MSICREESLDLNFWMKALMPVEVIVSSGYLIISCRPRKSWMGTISRRSGFESVRSSPWKLFVYKRLHSESLSMKHLVRWRDLYNSFAAKSSSDSAFSLAPNARELLSSEWRKRNKAKL